MKFRPFYGRARFGASKAVRAVRLAGVPDTFDGRSAGIPKATGFSGAPGERGA
ncbi:hypothetical protein [Afifella sp. IM 167]|uniref:hypothetical protein n=1 Tax=Afifella sp. IM 167 TaxID=2033586 RepID=UPI001CCB0921|nr:hypothetical protein [Afifella sp. IM 167]